MESVIIVEKTLGSLNKKLAIYLPLIFALAIFSFIIYKSFSNSSYEYSQIYSMNTIIDIKVWGNDKHQVVLDITKEINRLNNLFDDYTSGTDVSNINQNAGIKAVNVAPDTLSIISKSLDMYQKTYGSFNICIGPISKLWGFKDGNYRVPTEAEIQNTLKLINIDDLQISGNSIFLKKKGEAIDLGGIAKGYTLNNILEILKSHQTSDAIINMGGNILTYSTNPNKIWKIGIKDPRSDGIIGTLSIKGIKFIATSGDYERFFMEDGVRYCHIFDPKTGKPATKIVSITIIANGGYVSDALSTAFFVLGKEQSLILSSKFNVDIVGFDQTLKPFYTGGLKEFLQLENR
jgi:thiamine biosynthesis lipoprotein